MLIFAIKELKQMPIIIWEDYGLLTDGNDNHLQKESSYTR